MPRISRFKKRESDRSGFDCWEISMVKDGPWKVAAEEFDSPPPSKRSLGGEGDVSGEPRDGSQFSSTLTTSGFDVPTSVENPTFYITDSGGITPSTVYPFLRISGSNSLVDIVASPQIRRGVEGQVLGLLCVDSGVIIDNGEGINLMASSRFVMTSGAIMTFYYATGNLAWNETSRSRP